MNPPTPAPRFNKPKPPVVGTEQVTCSCGHAAAFELFPDKQDKFRAARRKKFTDRPCPPCRQKGHAEQTAKDQAAAAERKAARPPAPPRPRAELPSERLPHGATFKVSYDGQATRWRGTLTIPAGDGQDEKVLEGEASAVFGLLRGLDQKYRQGTQGEGTGPSSPATVKS